jgi:hypothetical protein
MQRFRLTSVKNRLYSHMYIAWPYVDIYMCICNLLFIYKADHVEASLHKTLNHISSSFDMISFSMCWVGSWEREEKRWRGGRCRTACSSQWDQKTNLMEETRQFIYTSTLPLTYSFLRPKHGPKVDYNIFNLYCASRVLNSRPLGSDTILDWCSS